METTATARRNFLTLLTAYFATMATVSVLGYLLTCGWLPLFDITINGNERYLTSYVLQAMNTVLCLGIFIRMLSCRHYGLTAKSRTGLSLMTLNLFSKGISDCLYLNTDPGSTLYLYSAFIPFGMLIIYIVGIIMFINGSPADRKMKRFIKWTPFIGLIITFVISSAGAFLDKPQLFSSPGYTLIFTSVDLLIFMNVYRLARRSVETDRLSEAPVPNPES